MTMELIPEIISLLGEWIYQISKWTLNLHYNPDFRDFNSDKNKW